MYVRIGTCARRGTVVDIASPLPPISRRRFAMVVRAEFRLYV